MFTIDQRRMERDLCRPDGSVAAVVSLDEAAGKPARDEAWARSRCSRSSSLATQQRTTIPTLPTRCSTAWPSELETSGLVRPEANSKEHLGLRLLKAHARSQQKPPRKPGVLADDPLAEAGRKVLRLHLLRMLEAENGSRDGDVESVHKMRVATRRMRAAWRVFNGAYKQRLQRRYVGELRQVAQTLGAVRDMDVQLERLCANTPPPARRTTASLEPLIEEWQRRRDGAREVLLDLLESKDYEDFVGDYTDFVDTAGAGARCRWSGPRARGGRGPDLARVRALALVRRDSAVSRTCPRCTRCASMRSECATRSSSSRRSCRQPPRLSLRS